jgi:Fe-S oxidoreductase
LHIAPERQIPRFAPISFRHWAQRHRAQIFGKEESGQGAAFKSTERQVILWLDTFNNYFHPETSRAALQVLEHRGFHVTASPPGLCCGRPLYDFGLLTRAIAYLKRILRVLGPQIDAGLPIVILEPSCASVFRDELHNLFPADRRADRLRRQTFVLSEFLERYDAKCEFPQLSRKVLLHGHCHQKALMKMDRDKLLLQKTGADVQLLDSGCCGMAGAFGFDRDKFQVSQAVGERVLLPAVRHAPPGTLIVSDGFSCREQIFQATGRKAIHLAEALDLPLSHQNSESGVNPY